MSEPSEVAGDTKLTDRLMSLKNRLPDDAQPWVDEYGPALVSMTAEEIKLWIEKLIRGDVISAYEDLLKAMPGNRLRDEWTKLNAAWKSENIRNSDKRSLQIAALSSAFEIIVKIAAAAVVL